MEAKSTTNNNMTATNPVPDYVLHIGYQRIMRNRVGMAKMSYKAIGKGSSRMVFDLGDTVLKLAYNRAGIAQNKHEAQPKFKPYYGNMVAPVVASANDGKWIIQQKVRLMENLADHPAQGCYQSEYNSFCRRAALFAQRHDMEPVELTAPANIGLLDGQIVIIDFGLSIAIGHKHYSDNYNKQPR